MGINLIWYPRDRMEQELRDLGLHGGWTKMSTPVTEGVINPYVLVTWMPKLAPLVMLDGNNRYVAGVKVGHWLDSFGKQTMSVISRAYGEVILDLREEAKANKDPVPRNRKREPWADKAMYDMRMKRSNHRPPEFDFQVKPYVNVGTVGHVDYAHTPMHIALKWPRCFDYADCFKPDPNPHER